MDFWVNCRRYSTDKPAITGAEIRAIANASINSMLVLDLNAAIPHEMPKNVHIGDGEKVATSGEPHFFTVPFATMYRGIGS